LGDPVKCLTSPMHERSRRRCRYIAVSVTGHFKGRKRMKKFLVAFISSGWLCCAIPTSALASPSLWQWANPTPQGNNLNAAVTGNGVSVAVGGVGTLYTSASGSWTQEPSGTTNTLYSIAYGGGQFTAVGVADTIITSTDGINWGTATVTDTSQNLFSVVFGNNTFVAVGTNGVVFTSSGGGLWSESQIAPSIIATSIAYGAGEFVAVAHTLAGATQIYYSSTGTSWTAASLPQLPSDTSVYLAFNGTQFLAMGLNTQGTKGASLMTSSDGKTWSTPANLSPATAFPISLTTNGSIFIVMLQSSPTVTGVTTPVIIETSTNGTSWTQLSSNNLPATWSQIIPRQISYTGSGYLVVGASAFIATSTDLKTWSNNQSPDKAITYEHLRGVHWFNNQFYAVGDNDTILTSTDGFTWINEKISINPASNLRDMAFNGSQYVAVGSNGVVLTSTDGVNWIATTIRPAIPAGTILQGIAWNGKQYVAVGTGGAIYTSPDGINWTAQNSGTLDNLWNVAWTGSNFVVTSDSIMGDKIRILISSDGINWTSVPFNTTHATSLYGLHWNGTELIASGSAANSVGTILGIIATSPDGENWTVDYSNITDTFSDAIISGTGLYAAVGLTTGNVYTSSDGLNWSMQMPPIQSDGMQNIAVDCGIRVATGYAGVILYNTAQPPTAGDGSVSTAANTAVSGKLQACGGTLTFQAATQPTHGTVTVTAASGAFTYTPAAGFTGTDSFTFTASNTAGTSAPATETISVQASTTPPTAQNGSVSTTEGKAVSGTLQASGAPTSFHIQTMPTHGSVTLASAPLGQFTYTPAAGFTGTDSFTFTASNTAGTSAPATETITVTTSGGGGTGGSSGGGGGSVSLLALLSLASMQLARRKSRQPT
jgi:photosystem II stability/assembly factor-like uncharacterized protein